MKDEMNLSQALDYIFGETQEELLEQEEGLDTKDYLDTLECPMDKTPIKNNNNINMKGNDNMKKSENLTKSQKSAQTRANNKKQMELMMEQMQAMMAQVQQLTNTVAQLTQENAELKAKATQQTVATPKYDKQQAMKTYNDSQAVDNYLVERNIDRDAFKANDRLNNDTDDNIIIDISDRLYSALNPSFYAGILNDYTDIELQNFYQRELTIKGLFSKEYDNLDSMNKPQLIKAIKDIKEQDFIDRMIKNNKKVYASEKQIELLERNNIDVTNIKYWWEASPILEGLFGGDKKPSTTQLNKIQELVALTGAIGFNLNPATKKEASDIINQLMDTKEEMFGIEYATDKQIELYTNMCKTLGIKLLSTDELSIIHSRDMSKMINEIAPKYNKVATASEGQIKFLTSLHNQLMKQIPENITNKTICKNEATKLIDKLSRELLYVKMKRTCDTITMKEINKLSSKEVQAQLQSFRANRQ